MSHPQPSSHRFSVKAATAWFALLLFFLPAGCTSVGSTPTTDNGLLRLPMSKNAAFEKRVQADPFPDASQALGNSLKSQTL